MAWVLGTIAALVSLALGVGVWYHRKTVKDLESQVRAYAGAQEVLRATIRTERSLRRAAETAKNEALRTKWANRVEEAKKVTTDAEADAAWAAAAARLRND